MAADLNQAVGGLGLRTLVRVSAPFLPPGLIRGAQLADNQQMVKEQKGTRSW
jgi:hypothetical protein